MNNYYHQNESSRVGLTRFFLQPSIGYSNEKGTLEAAFATRISYTGFKVKEAKLVQSNNMYDFEQVQDIRSNNSIAFIEPSLVFKGGLKNIKLQLQVTSSAAMQPKKFLTQTLSTSLGVLFSFEGGAKK